MKYVLIYLYGAVNCGLFFLSYLCREDKENHNGFITGAWFMLMAAIVVAIAYAYIEWDEKQ